MPELTPDSEVRRSSVLSAQGLDFRSLFEVFPDPIAAVNERGEIVWINAQIETLFGYGPQDLVEQPLEILVPKRYRNYPPTQWNRLFSHPRLRGIKGDSRLYGLRKDGSEFPVEIILSPFVGVGEPLATAAIHDMSVQWAAKEHLAQMEGGRQLLEDSLRDSEDRYRMVLDGIQHYAIFGMDPLGRIVSWNAGAERIKGYKADEVIGRNFSCFFPLEDIERGRPQKVLGLAAASGRYEEQGMRVRKDGSTFLASLTLTALRDSAGNLRGFSEFSHDLSESRQSEAKYRGLLEAAPDAMVVVNPGGEIVILNLQAEKQFGYYRDELLGQQVTNIIPEGFAERLIADGTRTAAEALIQQIGTGIELSGRRKDGSEFPIEIMLSPLENAEGIFVTAAIRDITHRKKSEAHLVKTAEELKRTNDQLEQFAYVASHDLQEPLRMVASYTQLLAKRYQGRLDSEADEFIAYAVDGCNRMQGLIRDLLAYSRSGTDSKVLREMSAEASLKVALTNLRVSIEESGAIVTYDLLPAIMTADTQLVQVFQNLIGNAIKYRGAAVPLVHVSARTKGGREWIFSVRDNGLGIASQYFERIFIIFQRLHGRQEFNGSGIGLAICKKIVERLGGRIWVESQLEKGSTFYFSLPEGDVNNAVA